MEQALKICDDLIAEAQVKIDENARDIMPSAQVENLWLGRRIGTELVRSEIAKLQPST